MSWHHLALIGAGAAGMLLFLFGVGMGTAYVLAESEARESKELADWRREEARRADYRR